LRFKKSTELPFVGKSILKSEEKSDENNIALFPSSIIMQYLQVFLIVIRVSSLQVPRLTYPRTRLILSSSGKGFGTPPPSSPTKIPTPDDKAEVPKASVEVSKNKMTEGQRTLAEMRRRKVEERDRELRKVKELLEMDQSIAEAPAAIPEKVAMRMGQRMLSFVGFPLFLGMGSFVVFWYMATYQNMEFEPVTVAASTIGLLAIGLFGITYSIFSTSWDEDREGDILGIEEAKRNLENVKDGLGRSRENAVIRDKMAGLSNAEIKSAIADLERRDQIQNKNE
jgi:Photosynthesis affected mutant 68